MGDYYLLYMQPEEIQMYISPHLSRVTLPLIDTKLEVNDVIIPVRIESDPVILPARYEIVSINRPVDTMTVVATSISNRSIPQSELEGLLLAITSGKIIRYRNSAIVQIQASDLLVIDTIMGGRRVDEQELLGYIQSYITARGYYFEQEALYNYHICLKTRPFVILAGLSGTGKSKLSQLYAEALAAGSRERYLRLPVRPNWNDDRYLLGHLNVITNEYMTEPAVEFVMQANADPDNLYFFCLDEMNLAHVEYYFSQFLSAMEEDRPEDRALLLLSKRVQQSLVEQGKALGVPARLLIPPNLFFTGTINVDETTQPISDKVIDRANTIEFFHVDLDRIPTPTEAPEPLILSSFTWESYRVLVPDTSFRPQIVQINAILRGADLGLGYRVVRDIELYLANSKGLLDPVVAFDLQVKQRILPRVRGTEVMLSSVLEELHTFLQQNNLTRSMQRLDEMKNRLKRDGYTSFWR